MPHDSPAPDPADAKEEPLAPERPTGEHRDADEPADTTVENEGVPNDGRIDVEAEERRREEGA